MKPNKRKAGGFMLSVCFISMAVSSYGQAKLGNIENSISSERPVVTKGYYSIDNNAEKLKSSAGRLTFSVKGRDVDKSDGNLSGRQQKGYYSIGDNAEKKRGQLTKEGINFSGEAPARVIQSNTFPVITKGYYSIGNNPEKLQKKDR